MCLAWLPFSNGVAPNLNEKTKKVSKHTLSPVSGPLRTHDQPQRARQIHGRIPQKKNCHETIHISYIPVVDNHSTETDLVKRVQRGELEAFEELLSLHSTHLRAFVAMKLPIPHLIDEIAHETFVFAHRHIMDFEAGTDFGKWLRAIAFNLVRKETLRHQRLSKNREKYLEHHIVQEAVRGEFTPDSPAVVFLEECLQKLPDKQQKLLEHKYRLSQSSREIAEAFDQSEAWVRTTLCRVRTGLRTCIENKMNVSPEPT